MCAAPVYTRWRSLSKQRLLRFCHSEPGNGDTDYSSVVLFCVYLISNPSFHVNAEFGVQERKDGLWIIEVNGITC